MCLTSALWSAPPSSLPARAPAGGGRARAEGQARPALRRARAGSPRWLVCPVPPAAPRSLPYGGGMLLTPTWKNLARFYE